ncbi:putative DNA repair protein RAD50 [Acropora cervicornis]|uniref:DNA repair protein RAD50 n=1 Tax=Acropora cervicornis TaxID=6130 RepID=A0AAD9QWZ6_ACRCE|nr:putative DNA repair protein RAD50 [Acropora cervicornis]
MALSESLKIKKIQEASDCISQKYSARVATKCWANIRRAVNQERNNIWKKNVAFYFKCKFILAISNIQDLAKISENIAKICKDLIKNCKDLAKICKDLAKKCKDLAKICKDFAKICEDLAKIYEDLAKIYEDLAKICEDLAKICEDLVQGL